MTSSPRILALIVDYYDTMNAAELSLQLAQHPNTRVVHIDNGMNPPVELTTAQKTAGVVLLRSERNLGYAGGLNLGIRELDARQDFSAYWLLNSDLRLEENCLPRLLAALFARDRIGAVGPIVKFDAPPFELWGARGVISPWLGTTAMTANCDGDPLPRWSYIPGCSMLVRADAFRDAGGLPEIYRLYYEETQLCVQLQRKSWDLQVEANAVAYHRVNSMKAGVPARHFAYYFARNNLYFWKHNFGIPVWLQLPRTILVMFKEVVLPIRRASSWSQASERLRYLGAGLFDGIAFARGRPTRFERSLFHD